MATRDHRDADDDDNSDDYDDDCKYGVCMSMLMNSTLLCALCVYAHLPSAS